MREFKLWNKQLTQHIDLTNNFITTDVTGLGNSFNNSLNDTDNPNKIVLKQVTNFEDITLTINFGVSGNAYADYYIFMDFISTNKKNHLTLEYKTNIRKVYVDLILENAPKSQKNEFGILTETFIFKRLTPFYQIIKVNNVSSYTINNNYVDDILPKITVKGSSTVTINYTTEDLEGETYMAKTNELQFGVKNVKYALKSPGGVYGTPIPLAYAHEIALEPTFTSTHIYGDGKPIAEVVSDQGKTGNLIVVQIPHQYEKDMQHKAEMTDKSVADITQLDAVPHAIYYEVNRVENGINQTVKAWLLNVTSGKSAETFTQSQSEPTLNNFEIPLTILGDLAKGGETNNVYIDTNGNRLRVTRLVSKPGDPNYDTFHEAVPTPRISNILGVSGIRNAANGKLTRTHNNTNTVVQTNVFGDHTVLKTSLDNTFPFNKVKDVHYLSDVCVQLPLIYKANDGDKILISDFKESEDFYPHPLFVNKDGSLSPYVYVNKYKLSDDGDTLSSVSGKDPRVNLSMNMLRDYARAKSDKTQSIDWKYIDYLQTLFQIKYAYINSQSIFRGHVDHSALVPTGGTDYIIGTDGINNLTGQFKFLGIEDPYGNVYEFVDGILAYDSKVYISYDPDKYHSGVPDEHYEEFGPAPTADGYVTKLGFNPDHPAFAFPEILGGSSSTHYADYFYANPNQANPTVARIGGRWDSGARAGLFFWAADLAGSNVRSYSGGRFLVNPFKGG